MVATATLHSHHIVLLPQLYPTPAIWRETGDGAEGQSSQTTVMVLSFSRTVPPTLGRLTNLFLLVKKRG